MGLEPTTMPSKVEVTLNLTAACAENAAQRVIHALPIELPRLVNLFEPLRTIIDSLAGSVNPHPITLVPKVDKTFICFFTTHTEPRQNRQPRAFRYHSNCLMMVCSEGWPLRSGEKQVRLD